jgi:predicted double-glycine peptidase
MVQAAVAAMLPLRISGLHVTVPVESYKERQFRGVIRQGYDYSCGSASLATLLRHHYSYDVGEKDVLEAMYAIGDKEKILKEGFSLLDMKQYLKSIGLKADGFKAPLSKLQQVGVPAIALINNNGFLHFVVVKGVTDDLVLVGDPALGKRVIERKEFEAMWNNILFVMLDDMKTGKENFNQLVEWHVKETPIFSAALSDASLGSFTLQTIPSPNYFF